MCLNLIANLSFVFCYLSLSHSVAPLLFVALNLFSLTLANLFRFFLFCHFLYPLFNSLFHLPSIIALLCFTLSLALSLSPFHIFRLFIHSLSSFTLSPSFTFSFSLTPLSLFHLYIFLSSSWLFCHRLFCFFSFIHLYLCFSPNTSVSLIRLFSAFVNLHSHSLSFSFTPFSPHYSPSLFMFVWIYIYTVFPPTHPVPSHS